jgi:hypothetical protein
MLPTGTHAGRPARGDPCHPSLPFLLSAGFPGVRLGWPHAYGDRGGDGLDDPAGAPLARAGVVGATVLPRPLAARLTAVTFG